MSKQTIELSNSAAQILGNRASDVMVSVEMASRILAATVQQTEDCFEAQEWRLLAHAIKDSDFPAGRDPARRLVFELEDFADSYSLFAEYGVSLPALVDKVNGLSESQCWALITTVQLAGTHCPTQIDRKEWWTLAYRLQVGEPIDGRKKSKSQKKEGKPEVGASDRQTVTKEAETYALAGANGLPR
jgi:hypothetical protein